MTQNNTDYTPYQTRRAYQLGVANGIFFAIGIAFVDASTVLPTFVSLLTDSAVIVGLISAIGMGGWFLPQLFAARYAQPRPRKRPLYILAALLRGAGWVIAIPAVLLLTPISDSLGLIGFFLGYSLFAFGGGLGGIAFLDIVAKTVAPHRLGSFFGSRQFWGGLGGIGSGFLVRGILASNRFAFPYDYCLLMTLAFVCFLPGWIAFTLVREPAGPTGEAQPLLDFLRSAPHLLRRHREYRLLVITRLLLGGTGIALPFYILYCRRALGTPESLVGTYLSVQMAGSVIAIPLWAYLNDRKGPRSLVLATAVLTLFVPAVAFLASLAPELPQFGRFAFGILFFTLAAAGAGSFMGFTNYLLAIAPDPQRPLYIGVLNTSFAVTTFLPLLGGLIVKFSSFRALFCVAVLMGIAGVILARRLPPADQSPTP